MLNNGYQNLSLENIDISVGGTAAKLKDALSRIVDNKIVILGDIVLNGEEKLPVGVECSISVSLSTEPDDWDPDVDGEFIPENIFSVTFKDVYGYDLTITDNEVVTSSHQSAVDANIEDVAGDLIEGGTIENAKPLYFHPIFIQKISGSLQYAISFIILNNDETPFTFATFKQFIDALYAQIGSVVRFVCSGGWTNGNDVVCSMSIFAKVSDSSYIVVGTTTTGTKVEKIDSWANLLDEPTQFVDGVNKIN